MIKYQSTNGILSTLRTSNISILKKPNQAVIDSASLAIEPQHDHRPSVDPQVAIRWQDPAVVSIQDLHLSDWLLDTASLTERLQSLCTRFDVFVVSHQLALPTSDEIRLLNCPKNNTYIREVILLGDGVPWVFARSVIPKVINDTELEGIGSEPLGKRIFNDPRFQRGQFQLCHVDWHSMRQRLISKISSDFFSNGVVAESKVYGRRSCFDFLGAKMSVAELFLPDAPAYLKLSEQK